MIAVMILQSSDERREALSRVRDQTPVLPAGWHRHANMETAQVYTREDGLAVLMSAEQKDHRWWLHVSMSRRDRLPDYADMGEVKRLFIGDDRRAIQVFPVASRHVNIHPNCLHLWCSLEPTGDRLPDFDAAGQI